MEKDPCATCGGTGAIQCSHCGGSGINQKSSLLDEQCRGCQGTGKESCKECGGSGEWRAVTTAAANHQSCNEWPGAEGIPLRQ